MTRKSVQLMEAQRPTEFRTLRADLVVLASLAAFLYALIQLAVGVPRHVRHEHLSLTTTSLFGYALLSICRMLAAYALSMLFTLVYGYAAANDKRAERVLLPLLDVLQSVPILSFLPVVLLSLSAVMPRSAAAELASIVLIFTSQAWNLTFAWYQSLITIPNELREAAKIFQLNTWQRFLTMELPFAAIPLIWNSVMSWAGGWFFLMAAEIFTVGNQDFRLPGLGSYLQEAANRGDTGSVARGVAMLIAVVVGLDQFVWRPLLAWADRFKLELVAGQASPESWFFDVMKNSRVAGIIQERVVLPFGLKLDAMGMAVFAGKPRPSGERRGSGVVARSIGIVLLAAVVFGVYRAVGLAAAVRWVEWRAIVAGLLATLVRVFASLAIALVWTLPVGVAIGSRPWLATWLQPVVQIAASVPATALFPAIVMVMLHLPGGLDLAAIVLMLLGTQWYILFNVIAGTSAVPQELRFTASLLQLGRTDRWRLLWLPSLFPYMLTGAITASGGAWNASIVAEYLKFGDKTYSVNGIGAVIAQATADANYPVLLVGTLAMVSTVVSVNRLLWRPLYQVAAERFRME